MHMPDMPQPKKDWKHNIKSLQSSLISSVYLKIEIISVNVSKTKSDVSLLFLGVLVEIY